MSHTINFRKAKLSLMSLAKVGNPSRDEPIQTSRALCKFPDEEAELLTNCFLKHFRSLEPHHLFHHSNLESNELFSYSKSIFEDNDTLLEKGEMIARHLYDKSNHPNIKSGDLCIALVHDVLLSGQKKQGIVIIKSESKVPFLQISERDGDLVLTTEEGIYPEKIDKGCLIVNEGAADGYVVYLFDKGGGNTQFWVRDFVGGKPVTNDDFLTRRYSELCVAFAEKGLPEDAPQEARMEVASRTVSYLNDNEEFDLGDFEEKALKDEEQIAQFEAFKVDYEEVEGHELKDKFTVSKKEAEKAEKRLKSRMKLDVGVDIRFSSGFIHKAEDFMERGTDEERGMEYVKFFFYSEQ